MSKPQDNKPEKTRNISAMGWERNYQFSGKEQQFLDNLESNSLMSKAAIEYNKLMNPKSSKDNTPLIKAQKSDILKDVVDFQDSKQSDTQKKVEIPIFTDSQDLITKLMVEKFQLMSGLET